MAENVRKCLSQDEASHLGLFVRPNENGRNQARYTITPMQWQRVLKYRFNRNPRKMVAKIQKLNRHGEVTSTIEKLEAPLHDVPDGFKIKKISQSPTTGQEWIQYVNDDQDQTGLTIDQIHDVIAKYITPIEVKPIKKQVKGHLFDMLTFTDVHIGMDTDKYKNTMYEKKWDRQYLLDQAREMIYETINWRKSDMLVIDDLGDLMDGFDGRTTRGGHDLPQNMTNKEAFDLAIQFKLMIVDKLVEHYDHIVINNVCNDNHSGDFGYFVNSAFKSICELRYKNVVVNNHVQFISHYTIGKVTFLISHGKDDKALKFGFSVYPKPQDIEKIDQYCKRKNLYKEGQTIVFKKGDSHQCLFDECSSDDFFYWNYPAFSPSSNWIKNNYKFGRRGFVLQSFDGSYFEDRRIYLK